MATPVRMHAWISGKVQGVFFRESTRREAERVGVSGWVKNLPDGRVEAVFEGSPSEVGHLVEWCHQGPPMAQVGAVSVTQEAPAGEQGFHIVA